MAPGMGNFWRALRYSNSRPTGSKNFNGCAKTLSETLCYRICVGVTRGWASAVVNSRQPESGYSHIGVARRWQGRCGISNPVIDRPIQYVLLWCNIKKDIDGGLSCGLMDAMPYVLKLLERWFQLGWRAKIRNKERLEPPHATITRGTKSYRFNLRSLDFMDKRPDPSDVPKELVEEIKKQLPTLIAKWDEMYPHNPVQGRNRR